MAAKAAGKVGSRQTGKAAGSEAGHLLATVAVSVAALAALSLLWLSCKRSPGASPPRAADSRQVVPVPTIEQLVVRLAAIGPIPQMADIHGKRSPRLQRYEFAKRMTLAFRQFELPTEVYLKGDELIQADRLIVYHSVIDEVAPLKRGSAPDRTADPLVNRFAAAVLESDTAATAWELGFASVDVTNGLNYHLRINRVDEVAEAVEEEVRARHRGTPK